jgi:hypothetical protein
MLFYSHIWDALLKLASLIAVIVVLGSLHSEEWLQKIGVPSTYSTAVIIGIIGVLWILIYRQGLSTIASWLYARVNLGTSVSLSEARQLATLFQLDLSGKWVPLKEVKKLPKAERRTALLTALETLRPQRKAMLF